MDMIYDPATEGSWASAIDLLDDITKTHHGRLREKLPHLDLLADRVARARLLPAKLTDRFQREFTVLADFLEDHLTQQEGWLYPRVCHLCVSVVASGWACHLENDLETALRHAMSENREALEWMERVQESLRDACWHNRGPLVAELLKGIHELAEDLATHLHLETEVLFPRALDLLHAHDLRAMAI
jgi:regulator of cell morphogenesis and NO signaling